nr:probable protein phosphatase 2C 27 isoform X2 [Ipomoea trifida]
MTVNTLKNQVANFFKDFGVDIKEIECASEGKPSFLPVFRSGSCAEMGPKHYMEDEHIRIDNLAAYLVESASFSSPGAFYGYTTRYRKLVIANAGDCRAVLGKRGRAIELSKDHKPDCKSERHRIEKLGGAIYNGYLNGQLSVARALGDWHMKAPKGSACPLSAEPELQEIILTDDNEFLIMGCDGLWDVMSIQCAVTTTPRGSPHLARIFLVSAFWKNKFHTALVYELLRHKANEAVCWKFTWRPCIPRKFSFILWLALWNRLKTKDRLFLPDFESDCSLCIGQKESTNHLFFRCYFSQQVWSKIRESFGFPRNTIAIRSSIKWIRRLFKGSRRHSKAVYIALVCTVYHLWRVRNLVIHDSVRPTLDGLVNCIATDVLRVASSVRL